MKAKDIMNKNVIVTTEKTTIGQAMNMCIDNAISGLIVVDDRKNVVGVVTEKDLLVAYNFLGNKGEEIKDFVSREILSVSPDTSLVKISNLLVQRNIKRVPVLLDGNLVGVVSRRDIMKAIVINDINIFKEE